MSLPQELVTLFQHMLAVEYLGNLGRSCICSCVFGCQTPDPGTLLWGPCTKDITCMVWCLISVSSVICSCILEIRKVKEKQKEVSAGGETPDLVRDCNELALVEEILSE